MRHLVVDRGGTADIVAFGYFRTEDQNIFMESYAADVLHRAPVVFGDSDLVVLTEWICQTEGLFEVGKALLGNFKDFLCINIFKE